MSACVYASVAVMHVCMNGVCVHACVLPCVYVCVCTRVCYDVYVCDHV